MGLACPCPGHDRPPLRGSISARRRVRPRRALARPTRVADRRSDRAGGAPHGPGDRRLPERDVRQRAGADHRAARDQRGADGGRPRLADRERRRQLAARSRLLAALRRPRRARPRVELPLARAGRAGRGAAPDPGRAELERRPRSSFPRCPLDPGLDRAARRLRRGDVVQPPPPPPAPPGLGSRRRGCVEAEDRHGRARHRHGGDGADRRDPRRLARDLRREGAPLRLLRRRGDRRDRRERRRARRRRRRRAPRPDQARGRDRARLERPGGGLPDPRGRAPLVADRPAGAVVPARRDRRPRRLDRARRLCSSGTGCPAGCAARR